MWCNATAARNFHLGQCLEHPHHQSLEVHTGESLTLFGSEKRRRYNESLSFLHVPTVVIPSRSFYSTPEGKQHLGRTCGALARLLGHRSFGDAWSPCLVGSACSRGVCRLRRNRPAWFPHASVQARSLEAGPGSRRQRWTLSALPLSPQDASVGFWVSTSAPETPTHQQGGKGKRSTNVKTPAVSSPHGF